MHRSGGEWSEWSKHVLIEIQRLHEGQSRISGEQLEMNKVLSRNTDQLEIHIEGVDLARAQIEDLRDRTDERFKPLELYKVQVSAYWKVITVLALSPAAIYYALKIFSEYLHK